MGDFAASCVARKARMFGLAVPLAAVLGLAGGASALGAGTDLRVCIIGLDTPHCVHFSRFLNDPSDPEFVPGAEVVAGYVGGSPDIPQSVEKSPGYVRELKDKYRVRIHDTVEDAARNVDAIVIGSIDGRPHLDYVRRVLPFKKPLFVDKPLGGTLRDSIEIFRLAREAGVPCFSASSLRFIKSKAVFRSDKYGEIRAVTSHGPGPLEPHHPDLFWYGIHAVESLYTVIGPGCQTVVRTHTDDADVITGIWAGGRVGTVTVLRNGPSPYGVTVFGTKAVVSERVDRSYAPLVVEMVKFFQTGKSPVSEAETLEILTFMEAADESKRRGGTPVVIAEVLETNSSSAEGTKGPTDGRIRDFKPER